jgi:hypothetical protein
MEKFPGFFTFYWDAKAGKIWLEIDKFNTEFLYVESLPAGIGSNDIGLDRGQLGDSSIVRFDRSGPRVLLIAPNYSFRATSNNQLCGASKLQPRKAIAFLSMPQIFTYATLIKLRTRCSEDSKALIDSIPLAARSIFQTPKTFRKTQKSKPPSRSPASPPDNSCDK